MPASCARSAWKTVDDEIRDKALSFLDKAKADGKAVLPVAQSDRMHIVTHLSPSTRRGANSGEQRTIHEAGMAQLDDDIGIVMKKLRDMGVDNNTIVVFTTDNGTEVFTWPDGGQTPFAQSKGTIWKAASAPPAMIRGGQGAGGQGRKRHRLRPRLVPDLPGCRWQPEHRGGAEEGQATGCRTYKVISTAYNQMDMITGKARRIAGDLVLRGK